MIALKTVLGPFPPSKGPLRDRPYPATYLSTFSFTYSIAELTEAVITFWPKVGERVIGSRNNDKDDNTAHESELILDFTMHRSNHFDKL